MTLNWVLTPPRVGSGGHTTILRIVALLEALGHECRIYLNDWHYGEIARHRSTIRQNWPSVKAPIADMAAGLGPANASIATSWDTVYALARTGSIGPPCYFVQDFEPWFYPVGSQSTLAENTYRMGLHGITVGPWLAEKLNRDYGMDADWIDFGADTGTYTLTNNGSRNGVVFYARSATPRRGFEMGMMALELFARDHPDTPIHVFGQGAVESRVPTMQAHGVVPPRTLAGLYNASAAGLVLSFTNVSLVPWELMACGCTPVMNDALHNRRVLDVRSVVYAEPTPAALAAALSMAVAAPQPDTARAAAHTVRGADWEASARKVEQIIRRATSSRSDRS